MSHFVNSTLPWDNFELLRNSLNYKTTSLLLLCTLFIIANLFNYGYPKDSTIPQVGKNWSEILMPTSMGTLLLKGYRNYVKRNNKAFMIKGVTMIPPSLFLEARKLPSSLLSFELAAEDALLLRFSLGKKHSEHLPMIAHDLASNLNSQIEPLCDEIERTFDDIFLPRGSKLDVDGEWGAVEFHPTVSRMIGVIVSRVLVGKDLCRNERFTKTIANFAGGVIMQLFTLQLIPSEYLKKQLVKILPQRKRVAALREMVREPVLARLEDIQSGTVNVENATVLVKIVDMAVSKYFHGTTNFSQETKETVLRVSSTRLLALMFAAIDTTTMTLCQVIFDLIGHPKSEYADPLRREARITFEKNDKKWDINAINNLKLLDSFIKESQRLHSIGFSLGARKVVKPGGIKFSNGDFVPEGHTIAHPLHAVHRDPDNYENPDTFDGLRFARSQDGEQKALSGPQISDQFLAFGYGRNACPGRAFALVMIKLMMIRFLIKYDFKEVERPKDWSWGNGLLPDMKAKVLVKRADVKT